MPSLLAWRACCRGHYLAASKELHSMRYRLLAPFVPDTSIFSTLLTRFGVLIVGEAALSYIRRDLEAFPRNLELAAGNITFLQFANCLRSTLHSNSVLESFTIIHPAPSFTALRHISAIADARLLNGRRIIIYKSDTTAACSIVAGMWTSVLANFVTSYTFGCAYPRLTFNLRGILSRPRLAALTSDDISIWRLLESREFRFGFSSTALDISIARNTATSTSHPEDCQRSFHSCTHQGRFFGDRGSLVVLVDALSVSCLYLQMQCVAPFAPMAAWRLPNIGNCTKDCLNKDKTLPSGVVTMLTRSLEPDRASYVRLPSHPTVATANDRLPFTLPPLRRGSRRYSVC